MQKLIFKLESATDHRQRLHLLSELEKTLERNHGAAEQKYIKTLLYHRDWYIRREAAFLIDRYGIALNPSERWQHLIALQQFEEAAAEGRRQREALEMLFEVCRDPLPRIRCRAGAVLTNADCRVPLHRALLLYAAGDYPALVELAAREGFRDAVIKLLKEGTGERSNPDYHRRQCAFCLEQLDAMDNAGEFLRTILQKNRAENRNGGPETDEAPVFHASPLKNLLETLNARGIMVDGSRVFPEIRVGAVTGRVTYRQPPLQTWPESERLHRIQPRTNHMLVGFDYRAIEPVVLLNFLLNRLLLSLEDIPDGDIYSCLNAADRNEAKTWLNAVINGGGRKYRSNLSPRQEKWLDAIQELRAELTAEARREGGVRTIGGREIPLHKNESNLPGKAMNRLIQGSAADIFHYAVLQLAQRLREEHNAWSVYFLLFDEVWLDGPPPLSREMFAEMTRCLLSPNDYYSLIRPLNIRAYIIRNGQKEPVEWEAA